MYDYYGNLHDGYGYDTHQYDYDYYNDGYGAWDSLNEDIAADLREEAAEWAASRFFWSPEFIGEPWSAETIEAACWAMEDLDADGVVPF